MSEKSFYPHMIVGNFQKYNKNNAVFINCRNSKLLTDLKNYIQTEDYKNETFNKLEGLKTVSIHFIGNSINKSILSYNDLEVLYPRFHDVINSISLKDNNTFASIVNNYSLTEDSIRERLWSSYFAHYIINIEKDLIYNLLLAIKLSFLLEEIYNHRITTNEQIFEYWKKSKVVLPKPIFPLPQKVTEKKDPGYYEFSEDTVVETDSYSSILEKIRKLKSARKNILEVYNTQHSLISNRISETEFKDAIISDFTRSERSITEDLNPEAISSYKERMYGKFQDQLSDIKNYASQKYDEYNNKPKPLHEELSISYFSADTKNTLHDFFNIDTNQQIPVTINLNQLISQIDSLINDLSSDLSKFVTTEKAIRIGNSLIAVTENAFCSKEEPLKDHCRLLIDLIKTDPQKAVVQILGKGNANIIKQELIKYEANEIADIENILNGEEKVKTHRNFKRQEEYSLTETEKNEESSTDNKTSERFELAHEVNKLASSADQLQAGSNISTSFGFTTLSANVGYATQNANNEASTVAVNNAKEITQQATHNIQERVFERRSSLSINEIEVTNIHKVINDTGSNINGFYYWVDKVYRNQVYNIGERLMLEFLIPEPAAHYVYSQSSSKMEGVKIDKPIHPKDYNGGTQLSQTKKDSPLLPLTSHKAIDRDNYHIWAAIYNAPDINPPPAEQIIISKAYNGDPAAGKILFTISDNSLTIKEGYCAHEAKITPGFMQTDFPEKDWLSGFIGNETFCIEHPSGVITRTMNKETNIIPFSFFTHSSCYIVNIEVYCQLTPLGLEKWQIETYNAIINAYNKQKAEYDNAVSAMQTDNIIQGHNPNLNRKIEKTELKKWGIELLTLQRFCGFDAMKRASDQSPEMSFDEAMNEGPFVKFIEQAIDWNNMTYIYYPYFWSDKKRWNIIMNLNDNDPAFTDFLQAGYARVVVPVQPKFTEAILHYLKTKEIWLGEEMPGIDDELYLSIIDEIKTRDGNQEEIAVGEPWDTRVPTNLIMLTDKIPAELPGWNTNI